MVRYAHRLRLLAEALITVSRLVGGLSLPSGMVLTESGTGLALRLHERRRARQRKREI